MSPQAEKLKRANRRCGGSGCSTGISCPTSLHNPRFAKYAEICGAHGIEVNDASALDCALAEALAHDGPALVEIRAHAELV